MWGQRERVLLDVEIIRINEKEKIILFPTLDGTVFQCRTPMSDKLLDQINKKHQTLALDDNQSKLLDEMKDYYRRISKALGNGAAFLIVYAFADDAKGMSNAEQLAVLEEFSTWARSNL